MVGEEIVVSITAYDPSGGAGVGQDLKVFSSLGFNGCGVITGIISQTRDSVINSNFLPQIEIEHQLDAIFNEFIPLVIKIGIVGKGYILNTIKKYLIKNKYENYIVVDPVFRATCGDSISEIEPQELSNALRNMPTIIVANQEEFNNIYKYEIVDHHQALSDAYRELKIPILLTGIESNEIITDLLIYREEVHEFSCPKSNNQFHDMGGVLSSAIACYLARGYDIVEAVSKAKLYLNETMDHSVYNRWLLNIGLEQYIGSEINKAKEYLSELAVDICSIKNLHEIIPEVGMNAGTIAINKVGFERVVVFDRRITKDRRVGFTEPPHAIVDNTGYIARTLIACNKRWSNIQSAINIKMNDKIMECIKKCGLTTARIKGDTIAPAVEQMIDGIDTDTTPDALYHLGFVGFEPIVVILADSIENLLNKVLLITEQL